MAALHIRSSYIFFLNSDQPLRTAAEVEVHLDENGQQMISAWVETVVGDILVTHCPDFQSCKKFVK